MLTSLNDLQKVRSEYQAKHNQLKKRIIVCGGTGCVANGSKKIYNELIRHSQEAGLDLTLDIRMEDNCDGKHYVSESGCQGFCQMGPLLTIEPDDIHYLKVKPEDVQEIVYATIVHGKIIDRLLYVDPHTGDKAVKAGEIGFYNKQKRTVLQECGKIDPDSLDEYIAHYGYFAAHKAITEYTDQVAIIDFLQDYNIKNPSYPNQWNRSTESLINEWDAHNFAYNCLPFSQEHTKDADLDNNDGRGLKSIVWSLFQ